MLTQLQTPISAEPFTKFKRVAIHENFVVTPDLNLIQQVRVVLLNEQGQHMAQVITENDKLSAQQRKDTLERYGDKVVTKTTTDAWINPKTGQIVPPETEGAIEQRLYFQLMTVEQVLAMTGLTTKAPFAHLLFAMIANEMNNIDKRGDL